MTRATLCYRGMALGPSVRPSQVIVDFVDLLEIETVELIELFLA